MCCTVPVAGSFVDEDFAGCFMAYSDDFLFWNAANKVRAYAFAGAVIGGMPVRVREMTMPFTARGMAVHQGTGTLLVAGRTEGDIAPVHSVDMIDIRPPPADWKFVDVAAADRLRFATDVIGVAVDEDRGFVYVLEDMAQRITQYTATTRSTTAAAAAVGAAASSERKSAVSTASTVGLSLTLRSVPSRPE
jgi:hypothetical protein